MPGKAIKVKCGDTKHCEKCQSYSSTIAESNCPGLFTMNNTGRCDFFVGGKQVVKIEAVR